MRYVIKFAYDGSNFYGYQRQNNKKTVEEEIEKILTKVNNNKKVTITSSGRTDKGVHAKNQVAHFDLNVKTTTFGLKKLLNKNLNNEIYIKEVKEVDKDFHARYNILDKTYTYYINTKEFDIFNRNYVYQFCKDIDIDKLKEESKKIIGTHDFTLLVKKDDAKENKVRTIKDVKITKHDNIIAISITADGFLRKMVRNIVGILIEICRVDNEREDSIENYLDLKGKIHNKKIAPASGLYLENVNYR